MNNEHVNKTDIPEYLQNELLDQKENIDAIFLSYNEEDTNRYARIHKLHSSLHDFHIWFRSKMKHDMENLTLDKVWEEFNKAVYDHLFEV